MKNIVVVSIIVPIYNAELYIRKCIDSIINQTFTDIEIILVDDGSTDGSGRVCDDYTLLDYRIKTFHQGNKGMSAARKAGLKIALGQYICFVDADDYLEIDCIEVMYREIEEKHADFMHFGFIKRLMNGGITYEVNFPELTECFSSELEKMEFLKKYVLKDSNRDQLTFSIWSKIFKREFIKKIYSYVPDYITLGEDALCFVYAIKECKSFAALPIAKYNYIVRDDSMSHMQDLRYMVQSIHFTHELLLACKKCGFSSLNDRVIQYFSHLFYRILKKQGLPLQEYVFSSKEILKGKKIFIYGAGAVGLDFFADLVKEPDIDIIGIVDRNWKNIEFAACKVESVDALKSNIFDCVIIAVASSSVADDIIKELCAEGIDSKKIIYKIPKRIWESERIS